MEKKDVYLKRKQEAETKKLDQQNKVLKLFEITADGTTRLRKSELMKDFSDDTAKELKKITKSFGEKDTPIGLKIMNSNAKLTKLKNKQEALNKAKKQPEIKAADPSVKPVISL